MARKFYKENNEAIPAICFELSAPSGFSEITDEAQIKILLQQEYTTRATDGQDYYNEIRTANYLDYTNGVITADEAFELEEHLKTLAENLFTGNWLTAQNTNTNLALLGIYTQEMKNELQQKINAYISENY